MQFKKYIVFFCQASTTGPDMGQTPDIGYSRRIATPNNLETHACGDALFFPPPRSRRYPLASPSGKAPAPAPTACCVTSRPPICRFWTRPGPPRRYPSHTGTMCSIPCSRSTAHRSRASRWPKAPASPTTAAPGTSSCATGSPFTTGRKCWRATPPRASGAGPRATCTAKPSVRSWIHSRAPTTAPCGSS